MNYAELHAHTAYSFLDGSSAPAEMAAAAAEHGYEAFAITDHDNVCGAMEFAQACHVLGVRPITGVELTISDPSPAGPVTQMTPTDSPPTVGSPQGVPHLCTTHRRDLAGNPPAHITLLVESVAGWRNLCHLLTEAHKHTRDAPQRQALPPSLPLSSLEQYAEGLVCLSGCARDGVLARAIERGNPAEAATLARRLLAIFGRESFRIELQRPFWRHDRRRNRHLAGLAERLGVPAVATGNAHYHHVRRAHLADAFVAIRHGVTLEETEAVRRGNATFAVAPPEAMAARFADHPDAVAEATRLAERLSFDLTRDLDYAYPGAEDPDANRKLAEICRVCFGERYDGLPRRAEAAARLDEELRVIAKLGLSGFFLLHREMLELAREVAIEVRGPESARALLPPGRGRGSSVSSIVCYLTGLSHVDPIEAGLFLGRFLNDEITAVPDIDLDFPRDIREKLIPRVHEHYGHERSALVAAFPTYRTKGAIRELGKALGLPAGEIERAARTASPYGSQDLAGEIAEALGERASSSRWQALVALVAEAWRLPRHLSQHPGGMVISTRPLCEACPIVPAAMEGRQMVQWDKDSCADAGFLKIDLLGLGMLSAVERCVEEIGRTRDDRIDLSRIPLDDPEVFRAIRDAETTGVFQIESRAQMQMLPRSRPENLEELAVQVAIVRPGPIQGGAVHPYLERRKLLREDPDYEVPYDHPALEPVLSDTLGAIVFQDQVIQVAMALAGFSSGEAEGLRRAMSRKRSKEALLAYRERFIRGALDQGVEREVADRVFDQIEGFSGFGFPKSHAVAFGLLAYQSTWLRVHYGPELLAALLNEQPMGFYPPDALVHEAQRRGIPIHGPDVNASRVDCHTEVTEAKSSSASAYSYSVRIGLGYVKGLAEEEAKAVVVERERAGEYRNMADLAARAGVSMEALELLAWSGACASLPSGARRADLWRVASARSRREASGVQLALPIAVAEAPGLREPDDWESVAADYATTGMTLGTHPMTLLRPLLETRRQDPHVAPVGSAFGRTIPESPHENPASSPPLSSRELSSVAHGAVVEVAGMVVARQRPETANGIVFILLEDEYGQMNLIVPPPLYERNRLIVRTAPFLLVRGRFERREGVTNLIVSSLEEINHPAGTPAKLRALEEKNSEWRTDPSDADRLQALAASAPRAHSFGRR